MMVLGMAHGLDIAPDAGHAGLGGIGDRAMAWGMLGVLTFVVGILMIRIAKPGWPVHAQVTRDGLLGKAYPFACVFALTIGVIALIETLNIREIEPTFP